jgi:hypothetical protein
MSTKAIVADRPRNVSGPKSRSQKTSASSIEPTSSATWFIPTSATPGA